MTDDLVVRAKLQDEMSGPLQVVREEVKGLKEELKGTTKSSDDTSRSLSRLSKGASELGKSVKGGLTSSLKSARKWFTGAGAGGIKSLGKQASEGFSQSFISGLSGALKTPVVGPILVAALVSIIATVAPAIGAIAAGGLVTGFGAGLAGLGLVFAAKSEAVKSKWKTTLSDLGADMQLLSQPFESTLLAIAGFFRRTVDAFNPYLAKAFSKMAGPITTFVDQAAKALEQFLPAIGPITDAFNAVLATLGPATTTVIGQVAAGMTALALSVQKNPNALADTVRGIGDTIAILLDFIRILNEANTSFERLTGGTSLVEATFVALNFAITQILSPLVLLAAGITKVSDLVNALKHGTDASGQSMSDAANQTVLLAQGLKAGGDAAKHAGPPVEALSVKIARQKAATQALIASLFRLQNLALGLSGAQINLQSAIDDATASIKENGRTLNINTAAGRANQSALNNVAQSANAQTQAMIESGKGTAAAATAAAGSRASFVRLATQMGLSKKQAQVMAAQLIAIPNVTRTARLQANKTDLETKLVQAQAALKNPQLTATKRARLLAEITNLQAGITEAKRLLAGLPSSKTVTINTYKNLIETHRNEGLVASGAGRPLGDTHTSHARGGNVSRTLAGHARVNAALGGGYHVSNLLTGGGGLGRGSGDHQRGRAVDVVGRGLNTYAAEVRRQGGYAAVHGQGSGKHVHAVMGDTATSRGGGATGSRKGVGGSGTTVLVQPGAIVVYPQTEMDLEASLERALDKIIRESEERT